MTTDCGSGGLGGTANAAEVHSNASDATNMAGFFNSFPFVCRPAR
jgi:hypothetical protein